MIFMARQQQERTLAVGTTEESTLAVLLIFNGYYIKFQADLLPLPSCFSQGRQIWGGGGGTSKKE